MHDIARQLNAPVRVPLRERSYDIHIGSGLLSQAARLLGGEVTRAFIITHPQVDRLHGAALRAGLEGISVETIYVPTGERQKSVSRAHTLWRELVARGADRRATIIAFGGGVIGDLAGFVAATYLRGLSFIQLPTTLLAQVDASVGGKVAINLPEGKNLIGAFYQPSAVIADVSTLMTLRPRDYREGLAEVVKTAAIADADFCGWLRSELEAILTRDGPVLTHLVRRCCEIKARVVSEDETETNRRAILNYGHTVAHALESLSGYGRLRHGEAVAIGMVVAGRLSCRLGMLTEVEERAVAGLLTAMRLPTTIPGLAASALIAAMARDKKSQAGIPRFVLLRGLGQAEWGREVAPALVLDTLRAVGAT